MSTRTLIDRLVARAPSGWTRSTGKRSILEQIQQARDSLISSLGDDRIYRGTDNQGFPPYLKTVAGTTDYDINSTNLSCGAIVLSIGGTAYTFIADFVKRIFIDVTSGGYNDTIAWMSEPALYSDFNPYSLATSRLVVSNIAVQARPSLGNAAPSVTFPQDPGTEDAKYFCEFYWKGPALVSESIPLMVPADFEEAIEDAVVGKFQEYANGAPSQFTAKFQKEWKKAFQTHFHRSAQLRNNRTCSRPM